MHKHKRVLTSAVALLLCFLTLFSSAFAYTQQQATAGYPQPPTYHGGNNSSNSHTSYTDPVIVGYRFTCWRSTDFETAMLKGLVKTPEDRVKYMESHNEEGVKLGHSINIMCNTVDANGNRRTDYANGYNQTGLKMPHMLTNGEQNDFLDKLSLAHSEQKSDATQPHKITHSTATGLMLMDYAGSNNGNFTDTSESSYFEFTEPLLAMIDKSEAENKELSTAFQGDISKRKPLLLYSGYYTRDQWNNVYLNTSPENDGEAQNLHTYIYGFQSDSQMGTSLKGYDRSEGVTTISDIDYDGADVLPFNQNPANVIQSHNNNTWTNKNATLIATLCGLEVAYGEDACTLTKNQFGVYDYIIVEPIMMYYYYYTRYYVTASDTAILQAQSMRDTAGDSKDVWTSIYYGGYKLFDVCGKFPAVYGTYVYTEEPFFGVDGVFNATTQRGYPNNAFQTSRDGLNLSAIASDSNNKSGNADRKGQDSRGWNTYAFVFTTNSGHTLFSGGDNNMSRDVTRTSQIRIRDGQNSFFIAPYIAVESLIGAGIFMSGQETKSTPSYQIVYHANPNNGRDNDSSLVVQNVKFEANSMELWDYQTAIISQGNQPVGKIPTSYWTLTPGPNGHGIQDNTLNNVSTTIKYQQGKIPVKTSFSGWNNIEDFFTTYGDYIPETNTTEVHLYAAWNTKSLVTTLDRTYDSKTAQTLQAAALQDPSGSMWFKDANYLPKSISVVATSKGNFTVQDVIQLQKDSSVGYQWFQSSGDTGNLDNPNYDYYVVYSFTKNGITDADKSAIQKALNKQDQNDLLIYRNNGAPVKWDSSTNLFYFDFYTFKVDAPNCSVVATIRNYPDADQTMQKQSANGVLDMKLVRGSTISYNVTPDYRKGYYFDTALNFSEYLNWERSNGLDAHITINPTKTESQDERNNNRLSWNVIKVCNSCGHVWDTTATKCPSCSGTAYASYESRIYYPGTTTREVLGKQQHKYTVETGKTIKVIPRVDNIEVEPFDGYFVDIVNAVTGQTYIYSATPMNGAIEIPASANGVVSQAIAGDGQYYILVSATDQSGRNHMQTVRIVNTSEVQKNETLTVYVDYYTASLSIKTQSGGNHSGIAGKLYYTQKGINDINAAISSVSTDYKPNTTAHCSLCADTNYTFVDGVALKGLQLNLTRDSNEDWYMTSVKKNGTAGTLSTDKQYCLSFESKGDSSYTQAYIIAAPYHIEMTAAPYHYISTTLNGEPVNVESLGITAPSGYTVTKDANGFTVLRGPYNSNINSLSSIINASTNTHINSTNDRLSFTYNQDAVVYTTLDYYTVSTDSDNGYSSTQISSVSGQNVGNKAHILSSHNNYNMFVSCSSGHPRETDETITNTRQYTASATLKGSSTYADTSVSGKLTAYNTKVTKQTVFTDGVSTKISHVNAASNLYWRSNQTRYGLKFIFRINSVPYDSLPSTVNNIISLDGVNPLKFDTVNGQVVATGEAVAGTYNLYLNGVNTNMSYTVTNNTNNNVYTIDFYTLRVAAGTGISSVAINPTDVGNAWNGTLPYYRDGKRFTSTLAVWSASMKNTSYDKIYINARAEGEYMAGDQLATTPGGYTFNRWDTKRPTSGISITYGNGSNTTTTTRETYINAANMNHATVVQAEATNQGTPIDIPTYPEHNSIYYGVKVRTFFDGRLKTPWDALTTDIQLTSDTTYTTAVTNGVAPWATVLDLYAADGVTKINDPYANKAVSALLAPSREFAQNAEINTEYFYSGSNAYIANQYTYIDAFYYTQTIQTQVNGVNTPPWAVGTYKEASYRQFYKGTKVDTTQLVYVNDAGAYQTVMLKGMEIKVGGLPTQKTNTQAKDYIQLFDENFVITGNHAFLIPYYTVDMRAVCDLSGESLNCGDLTLQFNNTDLKFSVPNNEPALVMAGNYSISTSHSTAPHSDDCVKHQILGWDLLTNEVYILEYVDSGDGKNPYPVLTYTGESRPSTSTITNKTAASTSININDETHIVARYGGSKTTIVSTYTLTLNSRVYDENGNLLNPAISPIDMYRGNDTGAKYYTASGEQNVYTAGASVNVSAALNPQTVYYPKDISVTFHLTCPHCGHRFAYDSTVTHCPASACGKRLNLQNATSADVNEIYYATADSYAAVSKTIMEASMMEPEVAAAYLAANHIVPMNRTAAGTYVGTVPYAEDVYHLYVNGEKQEDSYDVVNTKKKEFVWGKPSNTNIIWDGTAGINGENISSTNFSDFGVTMDKNRTYTVYARQVITGEQSGNKSLDFVCATIYTSTDYETILPYNTTYVNINGVRTPLASAGGHTFFVAKGSNLSISAQRSLSGAYCEIFNGTINAKKTFLLSYNTVTVTGDKNITVAIEGTNSQTQTWLANYAVDNQAFQSANTEYGVLANGGTITNKSFSVMHSNVTVKTTAGHRVELVAVAPKLQEHQELIGSFEGSSGAQYLYIMEATAGNMKTLPNFMLSQHDDVTEQYIIGFSTNPGLTGNLASSNATINFKPGVKYNVIVNWNNFSVNIIAEEGTRFGAASSFGQYNFSNIPNGRYEVHMDGKLFITSGDSIKQATGSVRSDRTNVITLSATEKITTSSGAAFKNWEIDNTPGSAATSKAIAGVPQLSVNNNKVVSNQILNGTINYVARSVTGMDTQAYANPGILELVEANPYKVQVYLDDKLTSPFPSPVKVDGTHIELFNGESNEFYSDTFPKVTAVADAHDTGYTLMYKDDGSCPAITYDSATRTFKVYYYSVTYSVDPIDGDLGELLASNPCHNEVAFGPIVVAKGSAVHVNETVLDVSNHNRIAAKKDSAGGKSVFLGWTKNDNDPIPSTITAPTHFIAHFDSDGIDYKVTLHNRTNRFTGYLLNQTNDNRVAYTRYMLERTSMAAGSKGSFYDDAPNSIADMYLYGKKSTMKAYPTGPSILNTASDTVNITLNLTGYTSELAHKVAIKNISTGTTYTDQVAANEKVAKFNNIPSGYYQLYVDDIKYVTQFDYATHDESCKVTSTTNVVHTPHYQTELGAGGLIYVAPIYNVRYSSVSHWSQVRYNRVTGEYIEYTNLNVCNDQHCSGYGNHANGVHVDGNGQKVTVSQLLSWNNIDETMDPSLIRYRFECNECGLKFVQTQTAGWSNAKHSICPTSAGGCGSSHIRMYEAELQSPEIDEDLIYYVYSTYTDKTYAPLDIVADVEMAYPVYVQSVVDGTEQYPFYNNGTKISGAKAYLEYTQDGTNWARLESNFTDSGLAIFYVPMGTSYRIVGAHADEWAISRSTNNIIDGGFSLSKPYSVSGLDTQTISGKRYIIGDGDYDNNGDIDDPGIKYYVHYYTVTANAGHGIDDVNVLSTTSQSKYDTDSETVKATFQRGATARVSAAIADGYLPVYIRLVVDNATYTGRDVFLSSSSTTNTAEYRLTYNSATGRYEHNNVFGAATGTTYYVWANGKLVNGVRTSEYTGVSVFVRPYIEPVKWSGNCKHDNHTQSYNPNQLCDASCSQSEVSHISLNSAPFTHSFTVYHTIVEQADAQDNVSKYDYRYADDHPTDPSNPNHDPKDPDNDPDDYPTDDKLDEYPENTVYYYNLEVTGDAGTSGASGSGTYLEGAVPNVNTNIQSVRQNIGRTPIQVTLYLDDILWEGQTVTIGNKPATEIAPGVYKTVYNFASGTYAIKVTSPDTTLLDSGDVLGDTTVYGYITVTSTRTYTWKAWTDGHVTCSECGVKGACCDTDGTPAQCNTNTLVYCTNCHIVLDSNQKEQSCCTTGDKKHTWTTCPYSGSVYNGNCLDNLTSAQTTKTNSITIKHNSKLHGVTTHKDAFTFTGSNNIYFYTIHIDGDAGVDNVYIDGKKYEETVTIHNHGTTANKSSVYHNDLPERLWTNTYHERTFFKEVVALYERRTDINATPKAPVKNHAEAKTALAIKLTLNGNAYTGRSVTIGGYVATDSDNDGIYVTAYSGFVGGKTYPITVDGRAAGRIYLESYRSYRWLTWEEPWIDASGDWEREHECVYHDMMHQCGQVLNCLDYHRYETGFYDNYNTIYSENFASLTARTEIIDEFHIYVDPNLNGGPDPYNPPSGDPDDPYKDPTDNDFYPGDNDIWGDPDTNPEEQPNPEYDPNHKPTDNPNYDPVNPSTPVDPSKDPDNFKPDDTTDGFYEDAPIPFYTLTVNTRLNNAATDDFPIKFENLTSGVTLYIIPDGQTYHVYDASGARLNNVPFIVSMADGKVVIALQDGDQYRISTLDEIEDRNNNDVIDINDIKTTSLQSYTYTTHTTGSIKKSAATVTIDFYTLTLDVYSDGVHKLPDFGKGVNGTTEPFESPVWLDDVATSMDGAKNWWNETTDSNGDGDNYAVSDHHTVKVYLKGQAYDVDVKTADDNNTSRTQKPGTGYLVNYKNGTITGETTIRVDYFSMTTDHYGGFTGTQINYGGKVHVSAATTAGATGNAVAKAFFLKDTQIEISASVATNNSWYQWTGTATYTNRTQGAIVMNQKRAESAWAKTSYTVRYYLHDKNEGWYQVAEDTFNSGNTVVINNRGWNSVTVTGEPSKYVNFDPFRTHSFSDPSAATPNILRDVLANGVVTTTIDVVVNANQVGGQSFIDFFFTRNGSKVDPTPNDPTIPDPVPTTPEAPTPTPQDPEDWDVDEKQEYVTITYVMNGGKYNGSSANYSETHLAGTDITLITPTPPAGKEFVGWFLTNLDGTTQSASGLIGTSKDHYLLCTDTVVYAVYVGQLDLGITANDIYGSIKTGSQFTSSATIVNHNNVSITPNTHINAVLTIMNGSTQVDRIVIKDIIVPGTSDPSKPGTQMISTVIDTTSWSASKTYTMTWSLDFSNSLYVDGDSSNNQSSLTSFKPNTYSGAVNTARPNYSTDRDPAYNKNTPVPETSNTAFAWEYWTWNENSGYNGKFQKQTGSDKMNIVLILTPENESGLRTYTNGTFGLHNYTTRSGYGLSMHRVYNDLAGKYANGSNWAANKSHITLNSTVGKLEALMTFPEFNYNSTYQSSTGMTQKYAYINVSPAGSYYSMTMLPYTDYETDDFNDQYAHYTPMWLPNGEYTPVTHISGMWTPIGELRATVQQGQYTSSTDMHKFGIYTNEVVIKGSLFDDLYNNP